MTDVKETTTQALDKRVCVMHAQARIDAISRAINIEQMVNRGALTSYLILLFDMLASAESDYREACGWER